MIAVVISYINRRVQLQRTLESIEKSSYKQFAVYVIDDQSSERPDIQLKYKMAVIHIRLENSEWYNSVPENIGFKRAITNNPDVVIIQNAECMHEGDIITHASKVPVDEYWAYHCYSLAVGEDIDIPLCQVGASVDGQSAWYNHEVYRPVAYHFCCAIRTENLIKLNGFDERYAYGIGYDDPDFVRRVRNLGLKIRFIHYPFVFHQSHEYAPRDPFLIKKNADLWDELSENKEYRAKHIITQDL